MSANDLNPQPEDWVVDIEIDGRLVGNRLWGSYGEMMAQLCHDIQRLRGSGPCSFYIPDFIDYLNALNTEPGRRYVVVQHPGETPLT